MASAFAGTPPGTIAGRYASLVTHRGRLGPTGSSARAADVMRDDILDGTFRPGHRPSRPDIRAAPAVSRDTRVRRSAPRSRSGR